MKKKILRILVIITMLAFAPITIFAYSGIDTNITIDGSSSAAQSSVGITNTIVGVLQAAGTIIAVVALIIIGMRYMFSSIEERAQMKGVIGYYIVGCILVLATSNVLAFAYDILTDLEHEYVFSKHEKLATCASTGIDIYVCKHTGCNKTTEVVIPKNNIHDMTSWITTKSETCTEDGTETKTCANGCGKTETRQRAKKGHSYKSTITKPATCTVNGMSVEKCETCGDIEPGSEITIAATGHGTVYNSAVTTPAGCTTEGVKTYTCPNGCGHSYTEPIAANGHDYKLTTTQATCTTDGKRAQVCQNCKAIKPGSEETIAATGVHSFGEWTTAVYPSCTSEKVETHSCSECGKIETKTILYTKLEHSYGEWEVISTGTCITGQIDERKCSSCGDIERRIWETEDHDWIRGGFLGLGKRKCGVCGIKEE